MAINSTLSFELQPEEDHEDEEGAEESGGEEEGMHLLYSTRPLERGSVGGCGVSHTPVPPHPHPTTSPTQGERGWKHNQMFVCPGIGTTDVFATAGNTVLTSLNCRQHSVYWPECLLFTLCFFCRVRGTFSQRPST